MIKEDYVSFEIANLLKEKGFDERCISVYHDGELQLVSSLGIFCGKRYCEQILTYTNSECEWSSSMISAPTIQMAMKWLRETFGIHCQIDCPIAASNWVYGIRDLNKDEWVTDYRNMGDNDTYEEACEAAIKYCLENLI